MQMGTRCHFSDRKTDVPKMHVPTIHVGVKTLADTRSQNTSKRNKTVLPDVKQRFAVTAMVSRNYSML